MEKSLIKVEVGVSGTADKLTQTIELLIMNFVLALVIVYLLMVALFGSFLILFVIMFTVPLAMAGGFYWTCDDRCIYRASTT